MSGQLVYAPSASNLEPVFGGHPIEISESKLPNKHTHIIFELSRGTLYYNDPRMFGYFLFYPDIAAASGHFSAYGLDPLGGDFTLVKFAARLRAKKGKLKSTLMAQSVVTGLGNIYADESAWLAKISPLRGVQSLKSQEIKALYQAIQKIIPRAIELGGSSVATYRLADGSRGNYARELKVYGRGGQKCLRCGRKLTKIQVNNRTTVYCPNCQK